MVNFIIKSNDNIIINFNLNLINDEYNINGKNGLNIYIQNEILNNFFISQKNKNLICTYVYHNLSITIFSIFVNILKVKILFILHLNRLNGYVVVI